LRKLRYIPIAIITIAVILFGMLAFFTISDRQIDYDVALGETVVPTYDQITIPFNQQHSDETSVPFTASAVIDIDNDGTEELFIGGGYQQENGLFRFENDQFVPVEGIAGITKQADGTAIGALTLDVNKDGQSDLLVTHREGIWLYMNSGGKFTAQKLDTKLKEDTTGLSIAVADINNDGAFDMYVSGYIRTELVEGLNIFNKEGYGGTSALFINNGDNTFTNETAKRGLEYLHNTFQAAFGDFEGDGDLDLIVAHDTGHVRTWINDGTGNFANAKNPNSELPSYPMGIGIADLNNDGLTDYVFSNIGSTPPTFLVRGDLREDQTLHRKYISFVADGAGNFTDNAEAIKIADYEFGWGLSYEDLNLDGREDLIVSQNFVTAPFHKVPFLRLPGRLFVQTEQGEMAEVGSKAGVVNRQYSIAPITADFNGDGQPDIVHINIAGNSQAFLSKGGSENGYLKIKLPDDITSIGAKVEVTLQDGSIVRKVYASGEGLVSDSSHIIIAGLGKQKAKKVTIRFIDGKTQEIVGDYRDEMVTF